MTLVYPKWLPGEHAPTGPITDLVGLPFSRRRGSPINWQRDPVDMYAFHLDVPAGATVIDVTLEFLSAGSTRVQLGGLGHAAPGRRHLEPAAALSRTGANTDQVTDRVAADDSTGLAGTAPSLTSDDREPGRAPVRGRCRSPPWSIHRC